MSDLISRQDALDALMKFYVSNGIETIHWTGIKAMLESYVPSADTCENASEITRKSNATDLISRQDALNCIKKLYAGHTACNMFQALDAVAEYIEELPSAERKGKWIYQTQYNRIQCSVCETVYRNTFAPKNFCPNCGARMVGEPEKRVYNAFSNKSNGNKPKKWHRVEVDDDDTR